ncbi:MAG: DUF2807 domain-containing protein [Sphingobacteriaceae bacterium]|nr:DUF2807 domain-containing protein [Sphingobacteriaceae bacterium]
MKKPILPIILVICSLLLCLATIAIAQTSLPLQGVNSVVVKGAITVQIEKGAGELQLFGDAQSLKTLDITIEDGVLQLSGAKGKFGMSTSSVEKVIIKLPSLESLKLSGAAEVSAKGFDNETLFVNVSGAGSCALNIHVKVVKLDVSGAAGIEMEGSAETVVINLSGAAGFEAENYLVKNMTLILAGAAAAEVNVSEMLDVNISGVGSVEYKGEPKVLRKRISGAGVVEQID